MFSVRAKSFPITAPKGDAEMPRTIKYATPSAKNEKTTDSITSVRISPARLQP